MGKLPDGNAAFGGWIWKFAEKALAWAPADKPVAGKDHQCKAEFDGQGASFRKAMSALLLRPPQAGEKMANSGVMKARSQTIRNDAVSLPGIGLQDPS